MNSNELQLKDIHLPEPVSWWPPTFGWWLVLILIIGISAFLIYWSVKRYRRQHFRKAMKQLVQQAELNYQKHQDKKVLLSELSIVLKRAALTLFPRDEVAKMHGLAWLKFLDEEYGDTDKPFQNGAGKVFMHGPYQPQVDYRPNELIQLVDSWVNKLLTVQR